VRLARFLPLRLESVVVYCRNGRLSALFLREDDDTIVPIPKARFERVFTGRAVLRAMPARVFAWLRSASNWWAGSPRPLPRVLLRHAFDAAGKADQSQLLESARAALDATISPVLEKSTRNKTGNIMQASSKFAQRRMHETYGWTPGLQLRKAVGGHGDRTVAVGGGRREIAGRSRHVFPSIVLQEVQC